MRIVCELCKTRTPLHFKSRSEALYSWSSTSYSDWLTHILSDVHQRNSWTRLHETIAITKKLSLEGDDEDIEICYYPRSSCILVHGNFPLETVINKDELVGEFLQYGLIRDFLYLSVHPKTSYAYVIHFENKDTVSRVLQNIHHIENRQVEVLPFSYRQCIDMIDNKTLQITRNVSDAPVEQQKGDNITVAGTTDVHNDSELPKEAASTEIDTPQTDCEVYNDAAFGIDDPFEISFPRPVTQLDKEFQSIIKASGLNKNDVMKRRVVVDKVVNVLKNGFPAICTVIPFGSSVTHIGTSKSNISISIEIDKDVHRYIENLDEIIDRLEFTLVSSKCFDIVPRSPLSPRSVKCTHITTRLMCDISLNNEIGIQQTRLISFYLDFDPRVRLLINLITSWAEMHQLIEPNGITTYTLTLLGIVFLTKMEIIPSVTVLQSLYNEEIKKVHGDDIKWSINFCTDKQKVKTFMSFCDSYTSGSIETTPKSVLKLFKEFCDFCCRVDFNNNMICTFKCSAFPKSLFVNTNNFPQLSGSSVALENYIKWASSNEVVITKKATSQIHRFDIHGRLSIQDPIDFCQNVSYETSSEVLQKFVQLCNHTSRSIDELLKGKLVPETLSIIFPDINGNRTALSGNTENSGSTSYSDKSDTDLTTDFTVKDNQISEPSELSSDKTIQKSQFSEEGFAQPSPPTHQPSSTLQPALAPTYCLTSGDKKPLQCLICMKRYFKMPALELHLTEKHSVECIGKFN